MKGVMIIKDNTSEIIYQYLKTVKWKPVVYADIKPGMYEVSNYGFIRNIHSGNIMSICLSEKGYAMVELMSVSGRAKTKKLHLYTLIKIHFRNLKGSTTIETNSIILTRRETS